VSASFDDPFLTLDLPRVFGVDAATLRRAYLAKSALLHPDLATDSEAPRRMAALNQAKRTLEDPERRANALLAILGGPAASQDRRLPEGFLFQMMETREAIEETAAASNNEQERERWQTWAEEQRQQAISEVATMFDALSSPPSVEALADIRIRLNAWRYIERLIEQLDPDYDPNAADFR
jgi:curved DNA-binding protein CbpA